MLTIRNFRVENLETGCVTDERQPRFSWYVESSRQGGRTGSFILSVNGWSVTTASQIMVPYNGPALQPFTQYEASLKAVDDAGETAEASLTFETGRLGTDWSGSWITDGSYEFKEKKASPKPMNFRRTIELPAGREIRSARLYATAMGIYQFYLHGERVGEDYFAPGFTSYRKQLQYQTYDITGMLQRTGEAPADLTAVVGGGWAVGRFTYKNRNRIFADRQALLAEVRITFTDGSEMVIGTDEKWSVSMNGPFLMTEFYNGETYDATVKAGDMDWHPASREHVRVHPKIAAEYGLPVRAHEIFQPVRVTKSPSGVLVYDMGQNFAGVIHAKIHHAKEGQRIVFTHAEILMDGELYRKPLRTAKQEAVYICREGEQEYSPTMTYMGFRYVGVEGIEEKDLELTGVALYSDIQRHGDFHCSNEMLNQLQSNILWGTKSNFMDIPTDCPQRDERLGWTGDIALFSPTAVWNFEASRFLNKWLLDVKADQVHGGGIPMTVPDIKLYWQMELVFTMAVDHWGDACILVPWAEYKNTGDTGILEQMYPTMEKYIKACRFWAGLFSTGKKKFIWKLLHHYGDWVAPDSDMWTWMRRGKFTATACLSHSSEIMAKISRILGKEKEAKYYDFLHEKTADAYRSVLMDENCHEKAKQEFQTGYVLPLYYDMLNDRDRRQTAANLVKMVRENHYHIGTGFPGTPYILFALADNGYAEDAYRMLLCDTCPSWLYEVKVGGTTIWERWDALREDGTCNTGEEDGTGGMVSFNHYASGSVGDFFYRRIAGVEALEGGYRKFRIAPVPGGGLTSAEGTVTCAYGKIRSAWTIKEGTFRLEIAVPVGTACEVCLPDGTKQECGSGSYTFSCPV